MGLMLSVLVTCVGVLEAIACWKHFENGYLPLSSQSSDSRSRFDRRNESIASSCADDVSRHLGRYLEEPTEIHKYGYTPSLAEHRRNEPNSSSEENSEWGAGDSGCCNKDDRSGCDDTLNCDNIVDSRRVKRCIQSGNCESSNYVPTTDRQDEYHPIQETDHSPGDVKNNPASGRHDRIECSLKNEDDDVQEELYRNVCTGSSATWVEADALLRSRSQFSPSPNKLHKNVDINWPVFKPPSPIIKKNSVPETLVVKEGEFSERDRFEVDKEECTNKESDVTDLASGNYPTSDVNRDKSNSYVRSEPTDYGTSSRNDSVDYDKTENCVLDPKVEVTSSEDEAEEKSRIGEARDPSFATSSREPKRRHKPARIRSFEDADPRHSRRSSRARAEETKKNESAKKGTSEQKNDTSDKKELNSENSPDERKPDDCEECGDDSTISEDVSNSNRSDVEEAFWLIFSGEYTKAMSKDWHSGHFSCWQCDESLTGQRYVLRDDHPYCIKCYESVFANACEECNKTIGIDSKDLSYKDKHWHEACFLCHKCRVSLVDKQFGSKADKIYCGNCYDSQFASRCDGCGEIFRAGTKKMEYKTRQWHEKCFCCVVCKTAIGTKSFIPREQEIYCATCYEEKFATRCVKCNKIITSGGVTYKNEPWHRECFTCTNCNTSLAGQRFTSRDEKPYCADCFGELFAKRCTSCSRPITGIGGTRFISFEDRHWHNDCFICALCKTSLVGRGFITDGDDIICPECAKQKLM